LNTNLLRIRELSELLSSFSRPSADSAFDVIFDVKEGECYGKSYLSLPGISVMKVSITAGAVFPMHKHETMEMLYVIEGSILLYFNGSEQVLKPGENHCFSPDTMHSIRAFDASLMWVVTVPTAKGFPNEFEYN